MAGGFERRSLPADLEAVRAAHAPGALVFDAARDFETLPPAAAEELLVAVEDVHVASHPTEWLPADAPEVLERHAGGEFTLGLPGDGSVAWTRRTTPPVVVVKPRVRGSPDDFVDFLVAAALVEVGLAVPESPLVFYRRRLPALFAAVPGGPTDAYQVALALFDGWTGLHARPTFRSWADGDGTDGDGTDTDPGGDATTGDRNGRTDGDGTDTDGGDNGTDATTGDRSRLGAAYRDAGRRLEPRLSDLHGAMHRGELDFPAATELACGALKHGVDVPAPFSALDTAAYRERGADYAVAWAEKTFAAVGDGGDDGD